MDAMVAASLATSPGAMQAERGPDLREGASGALVFESRSA